LTKPLYTFTLILVNSVNFRGRKNRAGYSGTGKRSARRPGVSDGFRAVGIVAVFVLGAVAFSVLFSLNSPFSTGKPTTADPEKSTDNPTGSLTEVSTNADDQGLSTMESVSAPTGSSSDSSVITSKAIQPEATSINPVTDTASPMPPLSIPSAADASKQTVAQPSSVPEAKKVGVAKEPAPKLPVAPKLTVVPKKVTPVPVSRSTPGSRVSVPTERNPTRVPLKRGIGAIVIDDAGNNLKELDPFLAFPGSLTIAVLPGLPHSAEAARRIRAAGKEVILHQPMEAIGGQNPGPGAIFVRMGAEEIRAVLERNIAEVGPIVGMNNHQGSLVTSDVTAMETILAVCREHDIYFLDSRTSAETVVPAVAARMGIRIRERDVFVDNIQERAEMIRFIQEGFQKAEKKGSSVMIGHAWSSELASTLRELYPELVEQGFSLSTISRIMMGTYDDEGFGD